MKPEWLNLQEKVQSELQPILNQGGYSFQRAGSTENSNDFVMWYEKDSTHRILIDVLKWTGTEAGVQQDFNWLRVDIGGHYLKELMGIASETNMHLHDGWTWITEEELDQCIDEIASGLKSYFKVT